MQQITKPKEKAMPFLNRYILTGAAVIIILLVLVSLPEGKLQTWVAPTQAPTARF